MVSLTLLTLAAGASISSNTPSCNDDDCGKKENCALVGNDCVPCESRKDPFTVWNQCGCTKNSKLNPCSAQEEDDIVGMDPEDDNQTQHPCAGPCDGKDSGEEAELADNSYCICASSEDKLQLIRLDDKHIRACAEWDNHDDRNCIKYGTIDRVEKSEEYDYEGCHNSNLEHCSIDGICFHVVTDFQGDHVGGACTFSRGNIIGNTEKCLCKVNKVNKDLRRRLRAEKLEPAAELLQ